MHIYTHICIFVYIHTCIFVYMCTHKCSSIHKCPHTSCELDCYTLKPIPFTSLPLPLFPPPRLVFPQGLAAEFAKT